VPEAWLPGAYAKEVCSVEPCEAEERKGNFGEGVCGVGGVGVGLNAGDGSGYGSVGLADKGEGVFECI